MKTHIEVRSSEFPAEPDEAELVNRGRFGRRLAQHLAIRLPEHGFFVARLQAEDWGWRVELRNEAFPLWIGVGNWEEYEDGFVCFIEPSKPVVRRWFRRIDVRPVVGRLAQALETILSNAPGAYGVRWWADEHEDVGGGVPLRLRNRPHWELHGRADSAAFFRHIGAALPTASTLFVEGTAIAADVREFLASVSQTGSYLPDRHTIWPTSARYRVRFDEASLTALTALAEKHPEPELADHLFVYARAEPLLEFPDAFVRNCPMLVSSLVDEAGVRTFAEAIGLELHWVDTE